MMIEYKIINIEFPIGETNCHVFELNHIGKRGWRVINDIVHDHGYTKRDVHIIKYLCCRNKFSGRILDIIFSRIENFEQGQNDSKI